MEYIIKVPDFKGKNTDIHSIKPLVLSKEDKSSDDEDQEDTESKYILCTVSGSVDLINEIDVNNLKDFPSENPMRDCEKDQRNIQSSSNKKCSIEQNDKKCKANQNNDENKLKNIKQLFKISSKNLQSEKVIYDVDLNEFRFSQDNAFNIDHLDIGSKEIIIEKSLRISNKNGDVKY